MTLGRALQELGQAQDARAEFEYVLSLAPDNLAAIRGLAELHGGDEIESVPPAPAVVSPPPPARAVVTAPPVRLDPIVVRAPEPLPEPEPLPDLASPSWSGPDLAAIDATIEAVGDSSAADAERAAQIERLEIWLAKLEQARESTHDRE